VSQQLEGTVTSIGVSALETGDRDCVPRKDGITCWPLALTSVGATAAGFTMRSAAETVCR